MTYRLTKTFRFESAHRLGKGYVGKCNRLHGHSWNGTLIVDLSELDAFDMGIDYAKLGAIVKGLELRYDHRVFLHREDALIGALSDDEAVVVFSSNPTSETLARTILTEFRSALYEMLGDDRRHLVKALSVTIAETCTTSCTVTA